MYLKRLEIKGFKSFAEHTELNLNPGINIIVGPNGCGKSNIVDAVRWVLGEANVRQIRGHKNEDVIFNGTDKQRPLGMAQVEMTVDNSDGSLPLAFSEISVSRKIFRTGESEFYLNKARVRLKDIVRLYTDTGLGRKGYSIISQGELERVLNGQPFDRRLMLEEAAGTIKYRQQRDEVLHRIHSTSQDLLRVEDILGELGRRRLELQSKAAKAQTYLSLRGECDSLERQVLGGQCHEAAVNLQKKRTDLDTQEQERIIWANGLADLRIQLRQAESELENHRNELVATREHKYEIENLLNRIEAEVKLSQERIKNDQERIAAANQDTEKYGASLEKIRLDLEGKQDDFDQQQSYHHQRETQAQDLHREIAILEQQITESEQQFEQLSQQVFEKVKSEAAIKNLIVAGEDQIMRAREKKERLLTKERENKELTASAQSRRAELQVLIEEYGRDLEMANQAIAKAEKQRLSYLEDLKQAEEEYTRLIQEIAGYEKRLTVLADLQRDYVGYSAGVKSILKIRDRGEGQVKGIRGLVADLIDVPAGMEQALITALGKGMEYIVIDTAESAACAINVLKHGKLGRATFLPLDVLRVQNMPAGIKNQLKAEHGVLGMASDLLTFEAEYAKVVQYLLGRVLVVQDLQGGLNIYQKYDYPLRIVSLDGELINPNGAMSGGGAAGKQYNPLQRKSEEREIRQSLAQNRTAEGKNRGLAAELTDKIRALDAHLNLSKNQRAETEFQVKLIRDEERRLEERIEAAALEQGQVQQEISHLEAETRQTESDLQDLQISHKQLWTESQQINAEIEGIKTVLESKRREHAVCLERLASYQEQLDMKKRELQNLEQNIAQFQQIEQSYRQSQSEAGALKARLQKEVELHLELINTGSIQLEQQRRNREAIVQTIASQQKKEIRAGEKIERLNAEIMPLEQAGLKRQEQIRVLEMRIVRLETEYEGLQARWHDKFGPEDPIVGEYMLTGREMRESNLRLEQLLVRLESLGSIDIDAIKEYDEIESRFNFLQEQTQDLIAAKASLEKLLQDTEKIMSQNFARFMNLADASFRRTFVEIFAGGEAGLEIESVSDLAAGVDIMVKMPGKRSQSLNLLSGGERALTCIAFIFALLRLKPAPFCLLDEIDAALDETNLIRFADFLKGMAQETQFIVITHRQATIEAGTNIFGITMPQEGISAVLSLPGVELDCMAG